MTLLLTVSTPWLSFETSRSSLSFFFCRFVLTTEYNALTLLCLEKTRAKRVANCSFLGIYLNRKIYVNHYKLQHYNLELVSKELNHSGVIAGLFRQIGGHSNRFVLFCSFWRLFTIKMIKSVEVFPFSFWKIITKRFLFFFIKFKPLA